ncbi:MAG TPA: C1 family peptidase [Terriglobia bacterium]|nr:C1 family peptidase [Terriglobia bacterium]
MSQIFAENEAPPEALHLEREAVPPFPATHPTVARVQLPNKDIVATGWLPDIPDTRDYTDEHPNVVELTEKLGIHKAKKAMPALPPSIDLRFFCSEIESQGNLNSCTAHAAVGIVEYFENRAFGKDINGSRLFVYKTTRDLLGWTGDTGANLRNTMAALAFFGVPPEKYFPYATDKNKFDVEPPGFVYATGGNYKSTRYFCHDTFGAKKSQAEILASVKLYLAHQIPSMFGFYGFPSFTDPTNVKGGIPYPSPGEQAVWGHAVAAVGYDDNLKIKNLNSQKETTGALLIRNSWGAGWGDKGYGWLPYDYVLSQFASDFWSLLKMEWIDTGKFGLPKAEAKKA